VTSVSAVSVSLGGGGLGVGGGLVGRLGVCRLSVAVLVDGDDDLADFDDVALVVAQRLDDPVDGEGRRRRPCRSPPPRIVVLGHGVARRDVPGQNLSLGDALAEVRQLEIEHGVYLGVPPDKTNATAVG